jgi:hypothetical protein
MSEEKEGLNNICIYCEKSLSNKQNLTRHYNTCKIKRQKDEEESLRNNTNKEFENLIKKYENNIREMNYTHDTNINNIEVNNQKLLKELKDTYEEKIRNLTHSFELKIIKLENTIDVYKLRCEDYKDQLKTYQESNKEITIKAIENTGTKTTNTINNRNQVYQSLQPLTNDFMQEQTRFLTYKDIKDGAHSIAHFASNHTFKDRVFCSDKSRLNFVFKNENDVIIKDPEGVEITKRFIEINKDELLRLLDEYFNVIITELDKDLDAVEYKHWAERREEILAIRSAIKKGNVQDNKEYYSEFKRSFLTALSDLVPR